MKGYICDRCGAVYTANKARNGYAKHEDKIVGFSTIVLEKKVDEKTGKFTSKTARDKSFDLCDDCVHELHEFLMLPSVNKAKDDPKVKIDPTDPMVMESV